MLKPTGNAKDNNFLFIISYDSQRKNTFLYHQVEMNCPNCNAPNYVAKSQCAQCAWLPLSKEEAGFARQMRADEELKKQKAESAENKSNLGASIGCAGFLLIAFWIFPSTRRGNDWFHLSWGDGFSAAVIFLIGYAALSKKE